MSFVHLIFVGFVALFPVVDPIGAALIVDPLLRGLNPSSRKVVSLRIALYCFVICASTTLIGSWLFNFFGISLPVVQIAGGTLIGKMGWDLLSSEVGVKESQSAPDRPPGDVEGILFYPLAFPITTGTGTISILLTLGARGRNHDWSSYILSRGALFVAIALMCILIYITYAFTPALLKRLGRRGEQVLNRLSAFLAFCVGLQIAVEGVTHLVNPVGS